VSTGGPFYNCFDEVVFAVVAFIGGAVVCIVALLPLSDKFPVLF
jgi:hypothetical protein